MIDVSTLISLIESDRKPERQNISGFVEPPTTNRNPGGFSDPTDSFEHEEKLWTLAQMNPNMRFYSNRVGRIISGWELLQAAASYSQMYPSLSEQVHEVRLRSEAMADETTRVQLMVEKALAKRRNAGRPGLSARDAACAGWRAGDRGLVTRAVYEAVNAATGRDKPTLTVREILTGQR